MSKNSLLRVGVVGVGFGQHVLIPAFRLDARCQVEGVCSANQQHAEAVSKALAVPKAYSHWRKMLEDPSIDAVSIAVPPAHQAEIALSALRANKAVFCEKPLSTSLTDSTALTEECERKHLPNMVDFEFPEIPHWQRAKQIIDSGTIGNLRQASLYWHLETYANRSSDPSWKTSISAGGGALNVFASHSFYYLEWLLGPISQVWAKLSRNPSSIHEAETNVQLSMMLASKIIVSVDLSTASFLGGGHRLEIYGDEGTLVLHNSTADHMRGFNLFLGTRKSNKLELVPLEDNRQENLNDGRILPVANLTRRFVDWVLNSSPTKPDFAAGLQVQRLIAAVRLSDQSGSWVDIKDI